MTQKPSAATGDNPDEPAEFLRGALRLIRLLKPYRRLTGVALIGLASISLNVIGPLLLGRATDLVFSGAIGARYAGFQSKADVLAQLERDGNDALVPLIRSVAFVPGQGIDMRALGLTLLGALLVYVGSGAFWALQGRVTTRLVQRTVFDLRKRVEDKMTRLPLSYFDGQPRGEVLSRTTNDTDNIAWSLQSTLSQVTNSSLLVVGVLAMMFWISPLLAVVALVAVPLSFWTTKVLGKRAQVQFGRQWKTTGQLTAQVEEAYTGHVLVKVLGRKQEQREAFREHNERVYEAASRAQGLSGLIGPATTLIGNMSYVLVIVIGSLQLAAGAISIGGLQAFIQYSRQFMQPLMALANLSSTVQSGVASAERVFDFLDSDEEQRPQQTQALPAPMRGEVRFENVAFRYQPDRPLIEDLSLTVEPGKLVAIVGRTGAGKTTLVNLLMRFYDVTGGRIVIDGCDIAALDRDDVRSVTGMVLQDTWLFGGTIRENIAYGRAGATEAEIVAAARAAQVDHFIRTLSEGYDTMLEGESGGVSAGERQLLTIARAILANPAILVLDEATSSVDTRTELVIQQAMAKLMEGRTTFVIAHRLSTIRKADRILMMEDGAIIEQGTHAELLEADGAYARLCAAEFTQPMVSVE